MATVDNNTPNAEAKIPPSPGPLRRLWQQIAGVISILGLINLSGTLIKWAALIHWIAEKYAIARAWLFGWLPWHIPPEWHDPIVLLLLFFSMTNVGVYRRTGSSYVSYIGIRVANYIRESLPIRFSVMVLIAFIVSLAGAYRYSYSSASWYGIFFFSMLGVVGSALITSMIKGVFLAWRWLLTTAAIFAALVVVNQIYVLWLAPMVEH